MQKIFSDYFENLISYSDKMVEIGTRNLKLRVQNFKDIRV